MPSDWGDDVIRHKYDPLPEEAPRHRKKSKKRHVRSDHKHIYEDVVIDSKSASIDRTGRHKAYHMGVRCKVCGRLQNVKFFRYEDEFPEDVRVFEVKDFFELIGMRTLPEELERTDR